MSILGDLKGVFEIGPVFRAEDSNTHRHLCEFVGLDFEMEIKEHYHEVLDALGNCFIHIFDRLNANFGKELEVVRKQHPFENLKYLRKTLGTSPRRDATRRDEQVQGQASACVSGVSQVLQIEMCRPTPRLTCWSVSALFVMVRDVVFFQ